ncbi:MAG: hypothetical protein HQK93_04985 [Nitrospirae bacterium]|nr:hypothetical protein [Nitrospirota bacterium]
MTPKSLRDNLQNTLDVFAKKGISIDTLAVSYSNDNNYTNISWRQSYTTASKPNRLGL